MLQHGRLQKKRKENVPTAIRKMHRCVSIFVFFLDFEMERETRKKNGGFYDILVLEVSRHASVYFYFLLIE